MKHTFYITDSTIFSKDEDMVKELNNGAVIRNDDSNLQFSKLNRYNKDRLFVRSIIYDKVPDDWYYVSIKDWNNAKEVAAVMDNIVNHSIKDYIF